MPLPPQNNVCTSAALAHLNCRARNRIYAVVPNRANLGLNYMSLGMAATVAVAELLSHQIHACAECVLQRVSRELALGTSLEHRNWERQLTSARAMPWLKFRSSHEFILFFFFILNINGLITLQRCREWRMQQVCRAATTTTVAK